MAMRAAAAAAAAAGFFSPSSVSPRRFLSATPPASLSTGRCIHRHRLRAFPNSELTLEELNPSVDLLRKTAEAVGDFRKTPIYIVGMDCTAKRNITKLLANSIIYRYLCSEELLEDVLGGKDALRAFRESDGKGYLEVETEGLKQLTSMGSLVLCCGDGAVMNSTNLGLLRHGVSIWIDVPLEMVVNDILKSTGTQAITDPDSFSQAMSKLRQQYDELKERYGVSDITVSVQNVASQLGYSSVDSVTLEDMVLEIVRQIERLIRTKAMMEAAGRPF
ncbi:probable inactive shikimate kinase like 1, chloroplastic isoform X2 [Phragmites australis]|uniref:probable inactive shikimate kinase like 1, chloroplastic isoform X2 n=1 Tax=Phragmites australis TaxID=29695 RepID=UPI002D776D27|nr:probable inactive shikimate kinase like 1, chloroplastic isoform X2 [Phragmites australis]